MAIGAMGGMPIGALLTQPQVPAPGVMPQDQNQMGLWGKFQERLKQDPNLRMALLTTGLNMMRTPQPGQSGFDVFADAALTGVGTLDQLRQRDVAAGAAARDERREEEKLDLTRTSVESQAEARAADTEQRNTALEQSRTQFEERMNHARDVLEEDKRQFNARYGENGTGAELTGAERMANAAVEALVTTNPEAYPDTPEGRAKARLVAQGLTPTADPMSQARIVAGLMSDLNQANLFLDDDKKLSPLEIQNRAIETFQLISNVNYEPPDTLDGMSVTNPNSGEVGKVIKLGEDRYTMEFAGGQTGTFNRAEMEQILRKQSGGQ